VTTDEVVVERDFGGIGDQGQQYITDNVQRNLQTPITPPTTLQNKRSANPKLYTETFPVKGNGSRRQTCQERKLQIIVSKSPTKSEWQI
jgi:hypothetical protein